MGVSGVVLSNHGGRQLDFARSGIEVLVEVVEKLKQMRGLTFPNERFQLFVDGGVRRASDVLKAIALGATAGRRLQSNPSVSWRRAFHSRGRTPIHLCLFFVWHGRSGESSADTTCTCLQVILTFEINNGITLRMNLKWICVCWALAPSRKLFLKW